MVKTFFVAVVALGGMLTSSYAADYSVVADFTRNGFFAMGKTTRSEIIQHFGKPQKVIVKKFGKDSELAYCTMYYMKYDGLDMTVAEGKKCEAKGLQYIEITSNKYKVKHDIGVGSPREKVIRTLGKPPIFIAKHYLSYPFDKEDEDGVFLRVDFKIDNNNRVSKIQWGDHL